jgi:hypothetical protein
MVVLTFVLVFVDVFVFTKSMYNWAIPVVHRDCHG